MKKRILAFLCTAVMLFCLLPTIASAAGSLECVDYTRFHGTGGRVTLTLGELVFEGQLSRGSLLSQSEQDNIIKQTMNDLSIASGMLINAKSMLEKAHKLEGFGVKDVTNALLKLTGAETAVDLYRHVMGTGEKTSAQIAADIAKGQALDTAKDGLEDILTNGGRVALRGGGKFAFKLLFILPDLTEIGLAALDKYENIKETVATAVERQLLLDTFYDTCNARISEASGDRGKWEIRFDKRNTQTYNCTFWGVPGVMMETSLSGVLEQVSEIDGYAGQYRGTLWLDIEGVDMPNFAKSYCDSSEIVNIYNGAAGYSVNMDSGKASLHRSCQGEISVMITGGKGAQASDVSGNLTSDGDDITFSLESNYSGVKGGLAWCKIYFVSNDIDSVYWSHRNGTTFDGEGYSSAGSVETDSGTVWKPLESMPFITVYK